MSDAALLLKRIGDKVSDLCANYVDATLHAGYAKYYHLTKLTKCNFWSKEREWNSIQFAGVRTKKLTLDTSCITQVWKTKNGTKRRKLFELQISNSKTCMIR